MKSINFINTLSAKQHRTLRVWWHFSFVLFAALVLTIIGMQSVQLYRLYGVVSEHTHLQGHMQKVNREHEPYMALKKEEEVLRAQRTKIDTIYHTAERSGTLLAALHATDSSARIQSCKLNKADFDLVVQCASTEAALNEVKRLRTVKQLQAVKLVSLQQSRNDASMVVTIHGKIRKV
jgi:hypothetical protein